MTDYFKLVNMGVRELKAWKVNRFSKLASLSTAPLNKAIRLVSKRDISWNNKDIKDALKAISFIKRMRKVRAGKRLKGVGVSKRTISLKNWGFNLPKLIIIQIIKFP